MARVDATWPTDINCVSYVLSIVLRRYQLTCFQYFVERLRKITKHSVTITGRLVGAVLNVEKDCSKTQPWCMLISRFLLVIAEGNFNPLRTRTELVCI